MASDTRDLLVRINGDTSGLNRAMGDAEKATDKGKGAFAGFQQAAQQVGAVLQAAGGALTAYAIVSTNFTVDYVRDAKTLARTTGETVTEASRLQYAFKRLGLDAGDATATLNIFSRKIVGAKDDAADAGNAFQRLGVNIKNTDGTTRAMSAVLLDVADKFKGMPNGVDKTALSMELFGRSGAKLIPLLNKGSDGIKELEAQADKLGITLTDKTIGGVEKYIESQKKLKETQDSLKIAIGTLTAPVLADFNNKLVETSQKLIGTDSPFRGAIANAIAFGGPILTVAGGLLGLAGNAGSALPLLEGLGISLGGLGSALVTFGLVAAGIAAAVGLVVLAFGGLDNTFKVIKDTYEKYIKPPLDLLWRQIKDELLPALQDLWRAIEPVLIPVLKVLGVLLAGVVLASIMAAIGALIILVKVVTEVIKAVTSWVNFTKDRVNEIIAVFSSLAGAIGKVVGNVKDAITKPFNDAFNWIKNEVGKVKDALGAINPWQRHSPSLVDYVKSGTAVIQQEYGAMFDAIRGGAQGVVAGKLAGTLPATRPVSATVPAGAPTVFQPTIQVNLGMYAGMPIEKRQIAVELWRELVREARSQGVQLPQIGITAQ